MYTRTILYCTCTQCTETKIVPPFPAVLFIPTSFIHTVLELRLQVGTVNVKFTPLIYISNRHLLNFKRFEISKYKLELLEMEIERSEFNIYSTYS